MGSRYLFFLDSGVSVPELGNLEVRAEMATPPRYLLAPDGTAKIEGGPIEGTPDKANVEKTINPGNEASLTARVEKAIADQARK